MLEEEVKYISNFVEEIKREMLAGKYNYNTELYLHLLRCERYLAHELKRIGRK
jgi:hypothetical protein